MAGSPVSIIQEVAVPFQMGPTGAIATVTSVVERAREHLISLLFTNFGERLMRPNYGSVLGQMLFENPDPITIQDMASTLQDSINTWMTGVTLAHVTPNFDQMMGLVTVDIGFQVGGSPQVHTITVDKQGVLVEI